jgi:hypothetical protein
MKPRSRIRTAVAAPTLLHNHLRRLHPHCFHHHHHRRRLLHHTHQIHPLQRDLTLIGRHVVVRRERREIVGAISEI